MADYPTDLPEIPVSRLALRPAGSADDARPQIVAGSSFQNNAVVIGLTRLAKILGQQAARETFSLLGRQSESNCSPSDLEDMKGNG
jgi:hypothetical protein